MEYLNSWKTTYLRELNQAESARRSGNEGMSRVCARRAAGLAIGEYFARNGIPDNDPSAYARINKLHNLPGISIKVQHITDHLLLRVDSDHNLPNDVDLIAETHQLTEELLSPL